MRLQLNLDVHHDDDIGLRMLQVYYNESAEDLSKLLE